MMTYITLFFLGIMAFGLCLLADNTNLSRFSLQTLSSICSFHLYLCTQFNQKQKKV